MTPDSDSKLARQIMTLDSTHPSLQVEKAGLEKNGKMVGHQIGDMKARLDEIQRALHEADGTKR